MVGRSGIVRLIGITTGLVCDESPAVANTGESIAIIPITENTVLRLAESDFIDFSLPYMYYVYSISRIIVKYRASGALLGLILKRILIRHSFLTAKNTSFRPITII